MKKLLWIVMCVVVSSSCALAQHFHFEKWDDGRQARERPDMLKEPVINGLVEKPGFFYLIKVANAKPGQGGRHYHQKLREYIGTQLFLRNYKMEYRKERGQIVGDIYKTGEIVTKNGTLVVRFEDCQYVNTMMESTVTKNGWILSDQLFTDKEKAREDEILTGAQDQNRYPRVHDNHTFFRIPAADRKKWVGKKVFALYLGFDDKPAIVVDETGAPIKVEGSQPLSWKRWGLPEPDFRRRRDRDLRDNMKADPGKPVVPVKPGPTGTTKVA